MKKIWIAVLLSVSLLLLSLLSRGRARSGQTLSYDTSLNSEASTVEHSSRLFDPQFFDQAYEKGKQYKKGAEKQVLGGIVPHHLLAAPLIAAFFEGLSNQQVDTVILLGPDHFNQGSHNVSISKAKWNTLYGYLLPDLAKIDKLEREGLVFVDEGVFENEHSIFGITPFIKRSFPDANIIPIVLGASTSKEECERLLDSLGKIITEDSLILASVDFSHYLSSNEADKYDLESIKAIIAYDFAKILKLDNQKSFDSPASLYILTKIMEDKDVYPKLLQNSNSAKLTKQMWLESTTSYVTMYFD